MVKELVGNNTNNYLYAITILAYYFEECDVFETWYYQIKIVRL